MDRNPDFDRAADILISNKEKPFVQRILNRDAFPVLNNDDGSVSTHSMAWGDADGRFFAYPTVVQSGHENLERLEGSDAWDNAIGTGNVIEFPTAEEAEWFSKNYKAVWPQEYR